MNDQEYVKHRVDDQIHWHDKKSTGNQRWHKRIQVLTIVAAAFVPFAIVLEVCSPMLYKVVVGLLGVIAASAAGVSSVYRFQELWVDYRLTAESLRGEKFRFATKTAPYDGEDAFSTFVERVESILGKENDLWQQRITSKQKSKTG